MYLGAAIVYVGLLVSPVIFHSAHVILNDEIPPKPLLIAHRGMRALAPGLQ